MKSFEKGRPIPEDLKNDLTSVSKERGAYIAGKLQHALPAISLNAHSAFFESDLFPVLNDGEDSWIIFYILITVILGIVSFIKLKNFENIKDTENNVSISPTTRS